MPANPVYFQDAADFRSWLAAHSSSATEVEVGFVKVRSGSGGLTWSQAVDEALCAGWIDGVRHRIDERRYRIRFTPRKPGSNWSAVNIRRVPQLQAQGRMMPAGLAAFAARTESRSRTASYEQDTPPELSRAEIRALKQQAAAWSFYQSLPASYQRKVTWWVISARQSSTRANRFAKLVDACAEGRRL